MDGTIFIYGAPLSPNGAHGGPWGPMGPYWAPLAPWAGGRWAKADGPGPMGLEDPLAGIYFRARGRWASRTPPWGYIPGPEADGAPWAPWASGTPPWGYHLIGVPHDAPLRHMSN